ncbi:MAG TPA: hypothetical protein VK932_04185 [Kofleriaceae bacterium]|nr:hypothetical protein [Kofleriaceae bacterium]
MTKLRFVAIAALLLAGCRKEPPVTAERGNSPVPEAPGAPDPAGPVETPAPAPAPAPRPPVPHPAAQGSNAKPTGKAPGPATLPQQGDPCAEGRCAAGLACVEYYGIAGPRGPRFTSCEIRCGAGGSCPAGQQCITIADGPGTVCRP